MDLRRRDPVDLPERMASESMSKILRVIWHRYGLHLTLLIAPSYSGDLSALFDDEHALSSVMKVDN
jgi:hypothetical protein